MFSLYLFYVQFAGNYPIFAASPLDSLTEYIQEKMGEYIQDKLEKILTSIFGWNISWTAYVTDTVETVGNDEGYSLIISNSNRTWEEQVDFMKINYDRNTSSLDMYDRWNRTDIKPSFIKYVNGQITKQELIEVLQKYPNTFQHIAGNAVDIAIDSSYYLNNELESRKYIDDEGNTIYSPNKMGLKKYIDNEGVIHDEVDDVINALKKKGLDCFDERKYSVKCIHIHRLPLAVY